MILFAHNFVIPEMRYTVMDRLLSAIINDATNDTQWRYDTINALILKAIDEAKKAGKRGIDYDSAKDILNFLRPSGQYPNYYGKNKKVIEGSLSLFDLKKKTVESHYGYYKDKWIKLTLTKYIT